MIWPLWYTLCTVRIYPWPAASMARGEVSGAWFGPRGSIVSVSFSIKKRPAVSKTFNIIVVTLARLSPGFEALSVCIVAVEHTAEWSSCTRL